MIDNIYAPSNKNILDITDGAEQRVATQNTSLSSFIAIFNRITSDTLTAISINNVNAASTTTVAPTVVGASSSLTNTVSSDGELTSPAIKQVPTLEIDDDGLVESIQIKDDSNTIRLGNLSFKEKP